MSNCTVSDSIKSLILGHGGKKTISELYIFRVASLLENPGISWNPGKSWKELLFSCKSWKIGVCYNLHNNEILEVWFLDWITHKLGIFQVGLGKFQRLRWAKDLFWEYHQKNCWTSTLKTLNTLLFNVQK